MGQWAWPAYVGILGGLALFVVFMIPIAAFQYRRYGRFTWRRFLGAAGLSVYGVALVAYTLLPLPDPAALDCVSGGRTIQLVPFDFVADIHRETAGLGAVATLSSRVFLQVMFNVVLFVPWGAIARRYFSRGVLASVLSGFLASVLIEATQYTGLWGLYGCPYRLADVDDLLANTAGALLGALVAPLVLGFMPQARELLGSRAQTRPVTVWRRWLGMTIDLAAFAAFGTILSTPYVLGLQLAGEQLPPLNDPTVLSLSILLPGLAVFYLPALVGNGGSLGQRAVWLAPAWEKNRLWRRLLRASVVGGVGTAALFVSLMLSVTLLGLLVPVLVIAAIVSVPLTGERGLSGVVSGARMLDARKRGRMPQHPPPTEAS